MYLYHVSHRLWRVTPDSFLPVTVYQPHCDPQGIRPHTSTHLQFGKWKQHWSSGWKHQIWKWQWLFAGRCRRCEWLRCYCHRTECLGVHGPEIKWILGRLTLKTGMLRDTKGCTIPPELSQEMGHHGINMDLSGNPLLKKEDFPQLNQMHLRVFFVQISLNPVPT